jgi:hypothetical protein
LNKVVFLHFWIDEKGGCIGVGQRTFSSYPCPWKWGKTNENKELLVTVPVAGRDSQATDRTEASLHYA